LRRDLAADLLRKQARDHELAETEATFKSVVGSRNCIEWR